MKNNVKNTWAGLVAVITGAASGIGRELAIQLNKYSVHVALADIDWEQLLQTQSLMTNQNASISKYQLDVSDEQAYSQFVDEVIRQHQQVNMVFNNAGVTLLDHVETQSIEDIRWVHNINFWGSVYGTQYFLPCLKQVDTAHIINISSVFGIIGVAKQSAYNASKFALRGYTEALRIELQNTHIGVTCVHPGGVKTNIVNNARTQKDDASKNTLAKHFEQKALTSADKAATKILNAVSKKRKRLVLGADAKIIDWIARLIPAHYEKIIRL